MNMTGQKRGRSVAVVGRSESGVGSAGAVALSSHGPTVCWIFTGTGGFGNGYQPIGTNDLAEAIDGLLRVIDGTVSETDAVTDRRRAERFRDALRARGDAVAPSIAEDRDRYREALVRALHQLRKHDYKGPKQISRALATIEDALGLEVLNAE